MGVDATLKGQILADVSIKRIVLVVIHFLQMNARLLRFFILYLTISLMKLRLKTWKMTLQSRFHKARKNQ